MEKQKNTPQTKKESLTTRIKEYAATTKEVLSVGIIGIDFIKKIIEILKTIYTTFF